MAEGSCIKPDDEVVISAEALKKAEEYIEEEEGATNRYSGWLATALTTAAIVMSLVSALPLPASLVGIPTPTRHQETPAGAPVGAPLGAIDIVAPEGAPTEVEAK